MSDDSRGIDPTAFRSRALSADMVAWADVVLTSESAHRSSILDDQPEAFRKVFTLGQLAAAIRADDSGQVGRSLLERLDRHPGTADPGLDVPDPYRRGPDVCEETAAHIDELLRVVVPSLTGARMIAP